MNEKEKEETAPEKPVEVSVRHCLVTNEVSSEEVTVTVVILT